MPFECTLWQVLLRRDVTTGGCMAIENVTLEQCHPGRVSPPAGASLKGCHPPGRCGAVENSPSEQCDWGRASPLSRRRQQRMKPENSVTPGGCHPPQGHGHRECTPRTVSPEQGITPVRWVGGSRERTPVRCTVNITPQIWVLRDVTALYCEHHPPNLGAPGCHSPVL
uniref:Uncharacterized protein n=1 Tax=Ficedula albicollis TaxID=59894 RepID=A0A803V8P6_FICAL